MSAPTTSVLDAARDFARRALHPPRPGLAAGLARLSGFDPARCALAAEHPSPWEFVVAGVAQHGGAWHGHTRVEEAWEALAPTAWIDQPQREFLRRVEDAEGHTTPAALRDALRMTADPEGIETAEALARALVDALPVAHTHSAALRVQWCVVDPIRWRARCFDDPSRLGAHLGARTPLGEDIARVVRAACGARLGGAAVEAATVAAHHLGAPSPQSPIAAPLFDLWNLGYALHALYPDRLVLVAPRL